MRNGVVLAVALILVGALALAYPTITYPERDEVIDIGPLEVTTETEESISVPRIVGGAAIAGGVLLLVWGGRARPAG
jgi:hypothetical protein